MQLAPMTRRGKDSNPSIDVLINNLRVFWSNLLLKQNFGQSTLYPHRTVIEMLKRHGSISAIITFRITIISYIIGIPLEILYTKQKDEVTDIFGHLHYIFVESVPEVEFF